MESLVHYKRMLLQQRQSSLDGAAKAALTKECEDLLVKLQTIDPNRRQRYMDLSEALWLHADKSYPNLGVLQRNGMLHERRPVCLV